MKKLLYKTFIFVMLISSTSLYSQEDQKFGSKKIGRETISNNDNSGNSRRFAPPPPGGGGEGDPIPIGEGLWLLIGLSSTYLLVKLNKNKSLKQ